MLAQPRMSDAIKLAAGTPREHRQHIGGDDALF
jgi:hypothetical protein